MQTESAENFHGTDGTTIVSPAIPYISQFASRDLVPEFLNEERLVSDDPRWAEFGFDKESYEYWAPRLCGLICLKMIADGYGVTSDMTVAQLMLEADRLDAYSDESGWRYGPLVGLATTLGLAGEVLGSLSVDDICSQLRTNRFVVASVHPGVVRGDYAESPNGRKGGHLVVVIGMRGSRGECVELVIANPSGRVPETQEDAIIPIDQFHRSFAGRGFTLWHPHQQLSGGA